MRSQNLESVFPKLHDAEYDVTSPQTPRYNCIAWAAGDTTRWWWPKPNCYWPVPKDNDFIESFVYVFGSLGYEICEDGNLEDGFEKVAIYAKDGSAKHMSRQLFTGEWTSKCGRDHDITHKAENLEGVEYGKIVEFMKRPINP